MHFDLGLPFFLPVLFRTDAQNELFWSLLGGISIF